MNKIKLSLRKKITKTSFYLTAILLLNLVKLPVKPLLDNTTSNPFVLFLDSITGGAFTGLAISCLGIIPFANAGMIVSLLATIVPKLQNLRYEGNYGSKKIKLLTNIIGTLITIAMSTILVSYLSLNGILYNNLLISKIGIVCLISVGTFIVNALCNKISEINLVNGASAIIACNILQYLLLNIINDFKVLISNLSVSNNILIVLRFLILILVFLIANCLLNIENKISAHIVAKDRNKNNSTEFAINFVGSITTAIIFVNMLLIIPKLFYISYAVPWINMLIILNTSILCYKISLSTLYNTEAIAKELTISSIYLDGINQGEQTKKFLDKYLVKNSIQAGIVTAIVIIVSNYCSGLLLLDLQGVFILVAVIKGLLFSYKSNKAVESYKGFLSEIK